MLKRIISIFAITLIITGAFFEGYSVRCPSFGVTWDNCDTLEEQTEAFKAYCKSRDLTIEGSLADAVTSFTTQAYQNCLNALGIDMNSIQSDIKRATDGNAGYKYLFNATGVSVMNRIFSQFLQDNDLSVGNSYDDDVVYSGIYYTGADHYTAEFFTFSQSWTGYNTTDYITHYGTYYKYNREDYLSLMTGQTITVDSNKPISIDYYGLVSLGGVGDAYQYNTAWPDNHTYKAYVPKTSGSAGVILYRLDGDNDKTIRVGWYGRYTQSATSRYVLYQYYTITLSTSLPPTDIYVTTNDTVINNNTYNNNTYTVINNDGDVYNYDTNDEPDPNPPVTPDPDPDPDPPNPDPPNGNGWDDFQLPEMPNDWLIYGMENKFPFDIPFNIMFALSLLNHDPVTPRFTGDIDLKVCTWHYDIDLSPFDDIAAMVRKFEVLAFIIGLAIMTHNLINWG